MASANGESGRGSVPRVCAWGPRPTTRSSPPRSLRSASRDAIAALLRGERSDLTSIPLELQEVPELDRRIYQEDRMILTAAT
jgi:hypothetical protein